MVVVGALAAVVSVPIGVVGQEPARPTSSAAPRLPVLKDQAPAVRTLLVKRAKRSFRLPDGTICDADQYYTSQELLDRSVRQVSRSYRKPGSSLTPYESTAPEWTLVESEETRAWGLQSRDSIPNFRSLGAGRSLFVCEDAKPRPQFIFVDETNRHDYAKSKGRCTRVLERHPDGLRKVQVQPFAQASVVTWVKVPPSLENDEGLPGKFVLWPDASIPHPEGLSSPKSNGVEAWTPENCVCRYEPIGAVEVTPDEIVQAVHQGRLVLKTWSWAKSGKGYVWSMERVQIRGAPERPAKP